MIDVKLPEEVLESLPSSKEDMVRYLLPYVNASIDDYEQSLRRRVPGLLGAPLDRREKSILRDFMLDRLMRNVLEEMSPTLHESPGA